MKQIGHLSVLLSLGIPGILAVSKVESSSHHTLRAKTTQQSSALQRGDVTVRAEVQEGKGLNIENIQRSSQKAVSMRV